MSNNLVKDEKKVQKPVKLKPGSKLKKKKNSMIMIEIKKIKITLRVD